MQYEKEELIGAVKELIDLMKESGLDYLKVKNDSFEAELGSKPKNPPPAPAVAPMPLPIPVPQAQNVTVNAAANTADAPAQAAAPAVDGKAITSPIVGTFYSAPAPGKPPFVKIGDAVNEGDVVCIIESMKVMNEIQAEFSGIVEKIEVADGEAVEFGQPLIILK
ncbi:MAG: acetyl-CoA carboxylase biotin carboxyl carrier protein [Eubacterium sp.]|nr:acetyl-CoA carboxylase biotin carboxyl carrier protein [Eubacterium sp.]